MKRLALIPLLALAACGALTPQQEAALSAFGAVAAKDLCALGAQQYDKVGRPSNLQQAAKQALDAACADPQASVDTLIASYNALNATVKK